MTYRQAAKLAKVLELWLMCMKSGMLACDSELVASYHMLGGMDEFMRSCWNSCSPFPEPCRSLQACATRPAVGVILNLTRHKQAIAFMAVLLSGDVWQIDCSSESTVPRSKVVYHSVSKRALTSIDHPAIPVSK